MTAPAVLPLSQTIESPPLEFELSDDLIAHEPPEARGLSRDDVRLMVSRVCSDLFAHTRFTHFADFLKRGDVLVVNTSKTINAAFVASRMRNGERILLHLSTRLFGRGEPWVVELRRLGAAGTMPLLDAEPGEIIDLPAGGRAHIFAPYAPARSAPEIGSVRLWIADLHLPESILSYSERHGSPIRYSYVPSEWPLEYYQTMFADEPGSVEMPSAGRAFTSAIVQQLEQKGVRIAPLVLHTGVSSLESEEQPYPERYHISHATAVAVNAARKLGGRVIAVGTTVVRALETAIGEDGFVHAGGGWTDLVVTPQRGVRVVDGMLTGLHAPRASHLWMLEAVAGRHHLERAYQELIDQKYLWHEFGDLHLILP